MINTKVERVIKRGLRVNHKTIHLADKTSIVEWLLHNKITDLLPEEKIGSVSRPKARLKLTQ